LEEGAGGGVDPVVRSAAEGFTEAMEKTRLADAGLADDEGDLTLAVAGTLPSMG
jgi:hypothetical protein